MVFQFLIKTDKFDSRQTMVQYTYCSTTVNLHFDRNLLNFEVTTDVLVATSH